MTKRNTRTFAGLLCLSLVLGLLAGCGGKSVKIDTNDLYGTYVAANKVLQSANSVAMDMDSSVSMDVAGQSTDIKLKGPIQYTMDGDKYEMHMKLATQLYGVSSEMEAWYKDGWLYTDAGSSKNKIEQPVDESVFANARLQNIDFPKDAVIKEKYEDVAEGTKLSFKIKGSALEDLTRETIKRQLSSLASSLGDDYELKIEDADFSTIIGKDGIITSYSIVMNYAMTVQDVSMEMSMDMKFSNIVLDDVKIDWPKDLDSYKEVKADDADDAGDAGDER